MTKPYWGRPARRAATLLAALAALLTLATGAHAAINGFEGGDGNQDADCVATFDWQCLDANDMVSVADGSGASDSSFADGSKQNEPNGWTLRPGAVSSKADVLQAWSSVAVDPTTNRTFLDLAFHRLSDGNGSVFVGFELNQARTKFVNPLGTEVPCRTDGDVLVSYGIQGGNANVNLFKWVGSGGPASCPDGGTGSFGTAVPLTSGIEAKLNSSATQNFLSPQQFGASFAPATFGEAAIDLTGLADAIDFAAPCEYFRRISVNTRSSEADNAVLEDYALDLAIAARACQPPGGGGGGGGTPPDAPTITQPAACFSTRDVTVTGTAAPGTTVTLYEGNRPVAFADADQATGAWSARVTGLADGEHALTADATDNTTGLTSARSAQITVCVDTTSGGGGTLPTGGDAAPSVQVASTQTPGVAANTTPKPAALEILSLGLSGKCALKPFNAYVTLEGVRRVRFMVDGKLLRTVRKPDKHGQFVARVDPAKLPAGRHRLTAKVTFRARGKKARVVSVRFRKCDKCVSRRAFRIRVAQRKADPVVKATVFVNGRRAKVVRGKRLTSMVRLTGLPKGRFTVKVRARTRAGRTVTSTRKYRTCTPKRARKK